MELFSEKVGQNRPIPKAEYLSKLAFTQRYYRWVDPVAMCPPPGHTDLILNLLHEITRVIGQDTDSSIKRFTLTDDRGRLMMKIVFSDRNGLSREQHDSVLACIQRARVKSLQTCALCGDTQKVKVFCRLHLLAGRAGLRFAEQLKTFSVNPYLNHTLPSEPRININDLPPLPGEPDYQDPLRIKLFDPACLGAIKKRADTIRDEQKSRLNSAIERMKAAGEDGYRSLGVFNDGAAFVAEFNELFPNFTCLGDLLGECAALSKLGDNRVKLPPVLLVGPAGVGKTEAASYIATSLNIGFHVVDMASSQTSSQLSGLDSMWANAQEGEVFKALCYAKLANPIILLDEIDKTIGDDRYQPIGPLYSVLEVTTARRFFDLSLREVILDASHINWIATANDISRIPKPILSRFVVFEIEPPSPTQARVIARNIYKGIKANADWGYHFTDVLDEAVLDRLVMMPPRGTRVALQRAFGAAAKAGRLALLPEDIIGSQPAEQTPRGFGFMSPI